jgi:hypothetical protein
MKVTAHITPKTGKGVTLYRTHWSRPYIEITKQRNKDGRMVSKEKKIYTTDGSYKNLIKFLDGKEKADSYKANHSRAKYND